MTETNNQHTLPAGVLANLSFDIPAGITVFLISIPLSLGIALASGAPLLSGLITGIIGGIVVAPLSKSALGISGTAAGLSTLVLAIIQEYSFSGFLLVVVLAGLIQILMGLIHAGVIAYYFPSSVVNGMLAGIGIILVLKQIPHALGYDRDYEGDFGFMQPDSYSSFSELAHMLDYVSPGAILISLVSLIILLVWERPFIKRLGGVTQFFKSILLVVMAGVLLNHFLQQTFPELALKQSHLVNLPEMLSAEDLLKQFQSPDFSQLTNPGVYLSALTLALVASLQTLLTVEAVDSLDPYKRVTPTSRELMAQGFGNACCGLLGGLPLTQVIVRSSVNIQSGAKTKTAAFVQGLSLLLAVLVIPNLLNQIPLASLAAILLIVGERLANPSIFKSMYKSGMYHFIPFVATILGLIFTNMLIGLAIGLAAALFSILLENYKTGFYFNELHWGNKTIIRLSEHVSFLNKANILRTLRHLPDHSDVVIDATRSKYIDYDVYQIIENFKIKAERRHINLTVENLRGYGTLPPLINARPPTYDTQKSLSPADVLELLKEGNERFINALEANRNLLEQVNDTRQDQFPMAIILSCMDSRTSVELIFDQGLGDIFSTRVAGNIINDDILGSMEYACKVAGSKLIVVLGHSHCGAIKGACAHVELDHLTGLLEKIQPAVNAVSLEEAMPISVDNKMLVQKVADKNVQLTARQIRQKSVLLDVMAKNGEIAIVGGMYDIETGRVKFFDAV
ncbi:MAG: carbonic anhydrase family protein [Methylococcales bacterium]|nr:bifunctional SulP family inorganic anion transporter/carbonic anhydrase [Methylococcaceae bacterium]